MLIEGICRLGMIHNLFYIQISFFFLWCKRKSQLMRAKHPFIQYDFFFNCSIFRFGKKRFFWGGGIFLFYIYFYNMTINQNKIISSHMYISSIGYFFIKRKRVGRKKESLNNCIWKRLYFYFFKQMIYTAIKTRKNVLLCSLMHVYMYLCSENIEKIHGCQKVSYQFFILC